MKDVESVMSKSHRVAITVIMLGLVVGCIPSRAVATRTAYARVGGLALNLWTSRYGLSVGESVDIRFTVENIREKTRVIELADRPVMDISISFDDVPIRWSDGREITPELTRLVLEPGESKTLEMTWVADERARNVLVGVAGVLRYGEANHQVNSAAVLICIGACLEH